MLMAALLAAALGCSHTQSAQQAGAAWNTTKEAFGEAYDAVKSGGREVAQAGSWVLERTKNGTVRVVESARSSKAARVTNDAWITTRLKSEYAVDRDVPARRVHVETHDGVVKLEGVVDNDWVAQKAIERALDTPGVSAVDSRLAWPEPPRYEKKR